MAKYINPLTDVGFKRLFGQEINKDLLIDFLNTLLVGENEIIDLQFLDKELVPVNPDERTIIYDVFCTTSKGEHIIVEMQNRPHQHFRERAVFYVAAALARQGEKGVKWSYDIKGVYGIFFTNFKFDKDDSRLRKDVVLADRDTGEQFTDRMRMIFISLPMMDKTESECQTDFERWIYVIKNMAALERMPFVAQKKLFHKLEEMAKISAMTQDERRHYEKSLKVYRDNEVTWAYATEQGLAQGRAEGIAEGRAEGLEQGRAEGIAEGLEQGRAEGIAEGRAEGRAEGIAEGELKKAIATAVKLRDTGMPVNKIEEILGFPASRLGI